MPARTGARRVLCARHPISAGAAIRSDDVIALRPGVAEAFVPAELDHLIGRTAVVDIPEGAPILLSAVT